MSDIVYHSLYVAESMTYQDYFCLYRGKGLVLHKSFRFDHSIFDENGNDIGPSVRFEVRYSSDKGSRYVKVEWRVLDPKDLKPSQWIELADHDSCWNGCWDDPLKFMRKILIEDFINNTGKEDSWFFTCDSVKLYPISDLDKY